MGGRRAAFMLPRGVDESVIFEVVGAQSETERGESLGGSSAVAVVGEADMACGDEFVPSAVVDDRDSEETSVSAILESKLLFSGLSVVMPRNSL